MKNWPHWIDKRDGTQYNLLGFCCYETTDGVAQACYILKDIVGGMQIATPYPGTEGSVIEQDTSRL